MLKKYVWVSLLFIFFLIIPSQAVYVACTNGTSATIDVNWTFTGAPGTDALIVNIGDDHNALLDITIPSGNDGSDGAANMTAGPQGEKGDKGDQGIQGLSGTPGVNGTTQDVSQFPFLNGNRSITGIWNFGGFNVSNLLDPVSDQDAATKAYVDSHSSNYNASYITSTYNGTYDAKPDSNYNASYWTGTNYNSSYWTGTNYNATYDGQSNYNASYITSTYNSTYDAKTNYNSSYVEQSNASYVLTDGSRTMLGNLTFTGNWYINGLTDPDQPQDAATKKYVDDNAGSNYNATYDAKPDSTFNATYNAYTNYNASYITSTYNATYDSKPSSTYNATYDSKPSSTYNATYDAKWGGTNYNASYWTGTNFNASYLTSTFNSTYDAQTNYNASYANKTQYSYLTLMAGSAMIPTTNPPANFDQQETTTNKNNFIYANITNAANQNVQWIYDMPADWDGGNIVANFLWSVQSGSGNVNWTLSGLRFDNNAAIDAALPVITYKVDTVLTAGYLHVSDATTAAAITGTGNVVIFKVGRSSTDDTLSTTPGQIIGVRIKYATTKVAA